MEQIKIGILAVLFPYLMSCPVEYGHSDVRDELEDVYESQVGVRESGQNCGEQVSKYLAHVGLDCGYAWCVAFTAWAYGQVGVDNPKSAWSPDYFRDSDTIWTRGEQSYDNFPSEKGNMFGIYFRSKERIAHGGFIDGTKGNRVITVEGNTNDEGSREGDGVYKKWRLKSQIYKVSDFIGGSKTNKEQNKAFNSSNMK